jgi:TonB family protein
MPTTEVPASPPNRPPGPPLFRRKRSRYEEMEPEELLHLIDRLEDERSSARKREGIWISVIAHLILFWFLFYGPKFLWHQPHVVNPNEEAEKKDMTYLSLPPDAMKYVKPKPNTPLSDKNRLKQNGAPPAPKPIPQPQRIPAPPAPPARTPPQQQQRPAPRAQAQQPQQAQPRQTPPPPPMRPTQQQPNLEEPKPAPSKPDFSNSQSAGDQIAQAMRNAARNRGGSSEYGSSGSSNGQPMGAGVQILSDTTGVDRNLLNDYIQRIVEDTRRSWYPLIPESARPPIDKQGVVGIEFKINPDGSVQDMILKFPSGDVSLDRAAWGGIKGASPYPAFPRDLVQQLPAHFLELRFGFYYNLEPPNR